MKTGIVLEGGALRTIFSSGACDGLLEAGLLPDYVIGVSAGIAYGVSYVSRQFGRNLEILTKYANDKRYMGKRNLLRPANRCYFGLKFTYEDIPNRLVPFDYDTFAAFPGEVEAVVTNLNTGKAEYLPVPRRDEHFLLLQATCAMPLLFPVYHLDGMPCLDGGAADAIPYERAFEMGCDRVVVVLTRPLEYRKKPYQAAAEKAIRRRYQNFEQLTEQILNRYENYNRQVQLVADLEKRGEIFVIRPSRTIHLSRIEKRKEKLLEMYHLGEEDCRSRMKDLEEYLGR